MSTAAAGVLMDARQLLVNEGWVQGVECKDQQGIGMCYCPLGAVLQAAGELKVFAVKDENGQSKVGWRRPNWHNLSEPATEAIEALAWSLPDQYEPLTDFPWASVEEFNDDPERTIEEVLEVFDKAIAVATSD